MAFSRLDIVTKLTEQFELSSAKASDIASAFFDIIATEVKTGGGTVTIVGFGTFSTKISMARKGRNPKTGEAINIPAKTGVRFKSSKSLVQSDKS